MSKSKIHRYRREQSFFITALLTYTHEIRAKLNITNLNDRNKIYKKTKNEMGDNDTECFLFRPSVNIFLGNQYNKYRFPQKEKRIFLNHCPKDEWPSMTQLLVIKARRIIFPVLDIILTRVSKHGLDSDKK